MINVGDSVQKRLPMNRTLTPADTRAAKKLTRSERKEWEARLSRWHSPAEMKEAVHELHDQLAGEVLFNQAGLNFALEGWIAVEFAHARGDTSVRLVNDVWPDIETRNADGVHRFEVVEADVPGRRRGQQYKEDAEKIRRGVSTVRHAPEDLEDRSTLIAKALRDRTTDKVNKRYDGRCNLLILLNFGSEYGQGLDKVAAILHPSTAAARTAFEEVWLLWRRDAYLLWRHGKRVEVELKPGYDRL